MNKQSTRQNAKQGQSTNRQATRQDAKQGQSAKSGINQKLSPNKRVTRQSQKQERRHEEQQRREAEQKRAKQRQRITVISVIAVIVLAVGLTAYLVANAQSSNGQTLVQETPVNPSYPAVDNIYCDTLEQTAFHIHAHLSIYINGQLSQMPAGVGIAPDRSCYYWLHTHNTDGIIHIESPAKASLTLGNYLDIWDGKFSQLGYPIQLADPSNWKVWIDGKPYNGNFRNIPLSAHELITLAYNSPNITPDTTYAWNGL